MYSKLVSYVRLSPHFNKRSHPIDRITIHHAAGNASVEALGALFCQKEASANYGIGSDGRIACFVEEENRSWASGSPENDHRAITIEVANCGGAPNWPVSDAAYQSLVELCADICLRHGFTLNFTGDAGGSLTMHKYFAYTVCPGPWLESRFPEIASLVNSRVAASAPAQAVFYRVQVGAFREKKNAEKLCAKLKSAGYGDAFLVEVRT